MIDVNWQYRGLQIIRLENELLSIDVLPELGAKIYNFTHRPSNRNLLWHNPRIPPARQTIGAKFDDVWSGGWDELIPNDIPTPVSGTRCCRIMVKSGLSQANGKSVPTGLAYGLSTMDTYCPQCLRRQYHYDLERHTSRCSIASPIRGGTQ